MMTTWFDEASLAVIDNQLGQLRPVMDVQVGNSIRRFVGFIASDKYASDVCKLYGYGWKFSQDLTTYHLYVEMPKKFSEGSQPFEVGRIWRDWTSNEFGPWLFKVFSPTYDGCELYATGHCPTIVDAIKAVDAIADRVISEIENDQGQD